MPKSDVFCRDCLPAMREYPDGYFDLAVVDPVYGGVTQGGYMSASTRGKVMGTGAAKQNEYHLSLWDQNKTGKEYFDELFRVSKNQIVWGGNYFQTVIGRDSQCWIVWDKENDNTGFADCELAWTSFNSATRRFKFMWNGMLQGDMKNKETRIHPTQKPVALYRWIYQHYAKPGDKILDTHMGSQSSRIAAYDAGLDYTGYEIDETYFKLGCERFAQHTAQMNLFIDWREE